MTKYITECKRGHPYIGDNVRVNAKGSRYCWPCHQLAVKSYQARHGVRLLAKEKTRRNEDKKTLVSEFGGRCTRCGYDESPFALDFDHLDPATKTDMVGKLIQSRGLIAAREEAKKCRLLCANCHRIWSMDSENF